MSNIHLRAASVLSLLLGIVFLFGSGLTLLQAQLSGHGSTLIEQPTIHDASLHGAAIPAISALAQAQVQLFLGMLLMMLGFLLYMLAHVRETSQNVRVKAVPRSRADIEAIRMKRRGPTFFWMEIKI